MRNFMVDFSGESFYELYCHLRLSQSVYRTCLFPFQLGDDSVFLWDDLQP
uniref:Uncharacterized protein n=1 Tax=Anguilla anguilla TaxID=7936 RepID=A0A0E9STC4_ANGAN